MSTLSSDAPVIPTATVAQRAHVAAVLSSAFIEDPIFSWMIPDPIRRAKLLQPFFEVFADAFIPHDATFVTESSVAMWAPVGVAVPSDAEAEQFVTTLLEMCGPDAARGEAVMGTIDSHHPDDPAAYLQFVGVDADSQGRGLGSAVMAPMLAACGSRRHRRLSRGDERRQPQALRASWLRHHRSAAGRRLPAPVEHVAGAEEQLKQIRFSRTQGEAFRARGCRATRRRRRTRSIRRRRFHSSRRRPSRTIRPRRVRSIRRRRARAARSAPAGARAARSAATRSARSAAAE